MMIASATTTKPSRSLRELFHDVRGTTENLCRGLEIEDYVVQSCPEASPVKWHLAHTSWFFETFLLKRFAGAKSPFHAGYDFLFNSYYNAIGPRVPQAGRGRLSRPTVREIYRYRKHVDDGISRLIEGMHAASQAPEIESLIELGLHHEEQHQELILTDLKNAFAMNPMRPVYADQTIPSRSPAGALEWIEQAGGLVAAGHPGGEFSFDNELPRHQVFLEPFRFASRLVTNAEYLSFMEDGGYRRPELWLSAGWETCQAQGWNAPLYWEQVKGRWRIMTLAGLRDVWPDDPVCHVSYFEADAYAAWAAARLPSEFEWEAVAQTVPMEGNFLESGNLHPLPAVRNARAPAQMFGDTWEWTRSAYSPYPGYRPASGALGEYNGKFMVGQMVLRGGSCVTPARHMRSSYRNFFAPQTRWQFSGIRLARDLRGRR